MQIFSGLVQDADLSNRFEMLEKKRQRGETIRTFFLSAFSQCKSESNINSITHIGAQRANASPLTSCAMTQKSSLHKSPDYPYVAEIDLYIWESNALKSLSERRERHPHLVTATLRGWFLPTDADWDGHRFTQSPIKSALHWKQFVTMFISYYKLKSFDVIFFHRPEPIYLWHMPHFQTEAGM